MNVEIFACSGGLAEGFRRAGLPFDMTFDRDPDACDSYEANLGVRPIQMDVRDLLRMVRGGWRPESALDLLVDDPPCSPWSRAGNRKGTADDRDMLEETCEIVALLRPLAYLICNIPGLDDRKNDRVVQRVIGRGLGKHGYCTADYARLDAADFGVPQHRLRPFWFGHLAGPCVRWPAPTHGDPAEVLLQHLPGHEPLAPWRTCREALGHLPLEERGRLVRVRNKPSMHPCSTLDAPANTVPGNSMPGNGGRVLLIGNGHPPSREDRPANTVTASNGGGAKRALVLAPEVAAPRPHHRLVGPDEAARTITSSRQDDGRLLSWPWDRPATTVLSGNAEGRLAPPGHGSIYSGDRAANAIVLSERAAAILQGFPETWTFSGKTKTARWGQIGQAVPPALAEAVARSVRAQLEAKP